MYAFHPFNHPICFAYPSRMPLHPATPNWIEHTPFGMFLVDIVRPKVIVELGTHIGISYCAFCQAVRELGIDTSCYAIDTWQGDSQSGHYGPEVLADLRAHHDPLYSSFSRLIQSTFDQGLNLFTDGTIDLLHIDGCHNYEVVKHDYEQWLPKMSDQGVILFHDTNEREGDYGVWRLWEELKRQHPEGYLEFLHGHGLGLLITGQAPNHSLRTLVSVPREDATRIRMFFHQLGQRLAVCVERDQAAERERALAAQAADTEQAIQTLAAQAAENERMNRELDTLALERNYLSQRLRSIESRVSWQVLERSLQLLLDVAPPASRRREAWLSLTRASREALRRRMTRSGRQNNLITPPPPPQLRPSAPRESALAPAAAPFEDPIDPYQTWIAANEPGPQELRAQRAESSHLDYRPLISVITPVYSPPAHILRATVESVQNQTYDNWQLCLVDGGSEGTAIRQLLAELAEREPRVVVKFLDHNLGIAGNSNQAAQLASGEFLALLDHDDLLAPNALFEVVRLLNTDPAADLIYFDEDKLTEDGTTRLEPFFKPGWSPEMLLSANYLMHSVIRRRLFQELGGFAPNTDGAQDWDLMLRCTERTSAIAHIPKVLYHWRQAAGSTAGRQFAKPYVFERQQRCVAEHLQRQGIAGTTTRLDRQGVLRVLWPARGSIVSIIIPTKDKVELLRPCLDSLLELTAYRNFEVVLVDTGSREEQTRTYYAHLSTDPRVRIVDYPGKFNYSAANNFGAKHASGELLLFLNNDIEVLDADWLEELVRWAELPEIGVVGAKLLYPDGSIQHAGVIIGMEGHASHLFWGAREGYSGLFGSVEWYRDYLAVTGACMMMRRALFDEVGGFDEQYELAFSDVEICVRIASRQYRNLYTPFARLRHHEGGSRGQHIPANDLLRGYQHLRRFVEAGDPYFNPNLSYLSRLPMLARRGEESRGDRLRRVSGVGAGDSMRAGSRHGGHRGDGGGGGAAREQPLPDEAQLPYQRTLAAAAAAGRTLGRDEIYSSGPPNSVANPQVLSLIAQHCQSPVLDLGCGIGVYVDALRQRGIAATGLEVDPDYVATAKALGRDIQVYDGTTIPFPDETFDTAIAIEVIEHIPDWQHSLREMLRVARRSVLISVPNIDVIPPMSRHLVVPWHLLEATHVNFFTPEMLRTYLRGIPGIAYEVATYGEFQLNGETFHNHIFAVIRKTGRQGTPIPGEEEQESVKARWALPRAGAPNSAADAVAPKSRRPPQAQERSQILDQYVTTAPSQQAALDIFEGEWASMLPAPFTALRAGSAGLFGDPRVAWGMQVLGGVDGKTVLELGPLEAGHTYMLEQGGAASIIAVEANTRAYLKCLIVKEVLGLQRARFLCGDFVEYLRAVQGTFDVCLASGVLYHMRDPVELIALLARATDRVFIWTHYYDRAVLAQAPHLTQKFTGSTTAERDGFRHTLHRFQYAEALNSQGFCGGSSEYSHWLSRTDILACLKHFGLSDIQINFDDPAHPNGPSFALVAIRP